MGSMCRPVIVLLVEDEIMISDMIGEALEEHGFAVHVSSNAEDALAYLESGASVDVLFTDINLPGAMDGAVLAVQARTLRPELPVVFASGRWNLLEELRAVPRSMLLPKPYSPSRACSAVASLIATQH